MEAYRYLSKAYDDLMSDVDYGEWIKFINNFLKNNNAHKVFEVACGTGKATEELYKLGYDITASDSSPEMLRIAAENARKNGMSIRYVLQDMRGIETGNKADAVVSVCDGPNYLDKNGLAAFAVSSYSALKNGGILLFDISAKEKLLRMDAEVYYDDGEDASCIWQNTYDNDKDILTMDVTLFIKTGALYERFTETHIQFAHEAEKVIDIMLSAGYKNAAAFKFLTNEQYTGGSDRIQFVCLK